MRFYLLLSICICTLLYACNGNSSLKDNHSAVKPIKNEIIGAAEHPEGTDSTQLLFEQKCAACHGSDGTAGIANAANLQASKLDSASIIKIIIAGKGVMPSFSAQLTKRELEALANYMLTLRK